MVQGGERESEQVEGLGYRGAPKNKKVRGKGAELPDLLPRGPLLTKGTSLRELALPPEVW